MKKDNSRFEIAAFRHQRILTLLRDHGHRRARELTKELGVTPMTIWRDLKALEEQGLLRRVRGGAQFFGNVVGEPNFEAKAVAGSGAKAAIAARAVKEFVRDGDVIGLGGGSTVAAMAEELPAQRISILTNSLPVALRLRACRPALPVRIIGGWLSAISGNTTGPEAMKAVVGSKLNVCFLGATAWDAQKGPMDPNPLEIEMKRAMTEASDRVVMLMDSRKFGEVSVSVLIHPKRIHALVTDQKPPREVAKQLSQAGVKVILAK